MYVFQLECLGTHDQNRLVDTLYPVVTDHHNLLCRVAFFRYENKHDYHTYQ